MAEIPVVPVSLAVAGMPLRRLGFASCTVKDDGWGNGAWVELWRDRQRTQGWRVHVPDEVFEDPAADVWAYVLRRYREDHPEPAPAPPPWTVIA